MEAIKALFCTRLFQAFIISPVVPASIKPRRFASWGWNELDGKFSPSPISSRKNIIVLNPTPNKEFGLSFECPFEISSLSQYTGCSARFSSANLYRTYTCRPIQILEVVGKLFFLKNEIKSVSRSSGWSLPGICPNGIDMNLGVRVFRKLNRTVNICSELPFCGNLEPLICFQRCMERSSDKKHTNRSNDQHPKC